MGLAVAQGAAVDTVNVIIEIPRGSANKYEYDHESHQIKLDRHLTVSMGYPAEYGFIPDTLGGDGDPLDALVLTAFPTFPGCLIESRILGMCVMSDENGRDEKLICVPAYDKHWKDATDIDDVPKADLDRISHFFTVYKDLEEGKWVKVENYAPRAAALEELAASRARYTG
ncbi:MAG: inorganic pyrophosphatase [Actinobacteria bacterium 21-73-9]|nr:MAG: inorganic pyrophosphatase [Actinobacteria bacterium 21-73-9]